jgi:hypothetical protein
MSNSGVISKLTNILKHILLVYNGTDVANGPEIGVTFYPNTP